MCELNYVANLGILDWILQCYKEKSDAYHFLGLKGYISWMLMISSDENLYLSINRLVLRLYRMEID